MTAAYRSPVAPVVAHLDKGVSDYLVRMSEAQQRADQVRADSAGTYTVKALRHVAHENDLVRECMTLAQTCAHLRTRAMMSAYRHYCWCAARDQDSVQAPASRPLVALSLAQVAADHAGHLSREQAPPGRTVSRCVLSTCHASNAPGLSCSARTDLDKAARRTN